MTRSVKLLTAFVLAAGAALAAAAPTGSAFTYQGRLLENGTPPTGSYDLEFTLYDVPAGGVPVLPPLTVEDVAVAAGLFTVSLDFGAAAFPGEARFMEIGVRPGPDTGPFTLLSGRQELRPTPNALAAPWSGVHGKPAGFADDVDNDVLGGLPCAAGEVVKWNGAAWACATDADSGGDITDVQAAPGGGLAGGASSGSASLGLLTSCPASQVLKWNGAVWACAADADSGGDITDVQAAPGGGLTGGATSGSAALGLLTSCPASQLLKWNGAIWACAPDADSGGDITDVQAAPGGGLTGGATSGSAALGLLTSCPASQLLKWNGATWACAPDADSGGDITGITAGTGLSGGGTSGAVTLQANFAGSGAAATVSHSDHDHVGQTWSGSVVYGLRVQNSNAVGLSALRGDATATTGSSIGVTGSSSASSGIGVYGSNTATVGTANGVYGATSSSTGRALVASATSTVGDNYGLQAITYSPDGTAISGHANSTAGGGGVGVQGSSNGPTGVGTSGAGALYGVSGFSSSTSGAGVFGWNQSITGPTRGVSGLVYGTNGTALYGESTATSGSANGVFALVSSTSGRAVEGWAQATSGVNIGVYGLSNSTAGYAGYFSGRVHVNGTLSKAAGSFKIDHPLDPANKYLYHSFVESPDMKNVYDGVVTTNAAGYATVELPDWFEALNRDFRYQLTVIDDGDRFALAKVAREMEGNRFQVRTSLGGVKVSWQVTGIRKDPYAEEHRIPVEEDKPEPERGKYLQPGSYGLPADRGVDYNPPRAQAPQPVPPKDPPEPPEGDQ